MKEPGNFTISSKCYGFIPQSNSYPPAEAQVIWNHCLRVQFVEEEFKVSDTWI